MIKDLINKIKWGIIIEKWIMKIPIIFAALLFFIYLLSYKILFFNKSYLILSNFLNRLFAKDRMSTLINISVVLIGFYVTIMSIFGSNVSAAIVKLSENELSENFIKYIKSGLFFAFSYFFLTIFFDVFKSNLFIIIYTTVFLLVLSSCIRICLISIKLYQYNIENASELSKEAEKNQEQILTLLQEIKDSNQKGKKEKYDKIKMITEKEKRNRKDLPYKENL